MPILSLLVVAAPAPQRVQTIWPTQAEIAAAALPVPTVTMSRAQADASSDSALAEKLIGHVSHRPIARVRRQQDDPASPVRGPRELGWVSFLEQGTPIGGRLCRSRAIHVTFDAVPGEPEAGAPIDRPRRVFWIHQVPTIAVVVGAATPATCADAAFVSVPRGGFEESVALIRQVIAIAEGAADRSVACVDDLVVPSRRCDPRATVAAFDWTRLAGVDRSSSDTVPAELRLYLHPDRGLWVAIAIDTADGRRITLRRQAFSPS